MDGWFGLGGVIQGAPAVPTSSTMYVLTNNSSSNPALVVDIAMNAYA